MQPGHRKWNCRLAVSDSDRDESNRELDDLFARVVRTCKKGGSAQDVRERVRTFLLYAAWHFAGEEAYMYGSRYSGYVDHKADHIRLLLEAEDFVRSLGNALASRERAEIVSYFDNWLAHHKVDHDQQLRAFINDMTGNLPPAG